MVSSSRTCFRVIGVQSDEGPNSPPTAPIRTVGHGTLSQTAFADLVTAAGIDVVLDVRRYPGSRRHPHFQTEAMATWLAAAGTEYRWLPNLGGRRKASPGSANTGLRSLQFRAYADYMAHDEFGEGVEDLLATAAERPAVVMCSEAVWWRCHRRLLADHLMLVKRRAVEHLFHDGRLSPHPITPEARPVGGQVVYDHIVEGS